jgi:hypothetical protein
VTGYRLRTWVSASQYNAVCVPVLMGPAGFLFAERAGSTCFIGLLLATSNGVRGRTAEPSATPG